MPNYDDIPVIFGLKLQPEAYTLLELVYDFRHFDFYTPCEMYECGDGNFFYINLKPDIDVEDPIMFDTAQRLARESFGTYVTSMKQLAVGIPEEIMPQARVTSWFCSPFHNRRGLALSYVHWQHNKRFYIMPCQIEARLLSH